jgi:AcrR family transcriptional regulator
VSLRVPDVHYTEKTDDTSVKPGVDQTRLRILGAARELYAEKGSRGTTTREVADRAGVNEATLFRHFGTKGQLLSAMLEHFSGTSLMPALLEEARALPTLERQLRHIGLAAIESIRQREDLIKVTMAEELSNPEGFTCAWRTPLAARVGVSGYMREKIAAGELRGDADTLARMFLSLFFAYVMARKLWADAELPPERAAETMVALFLNGARVK